MDESENGDIASPCVRNCCLDDGDICLGCFRSLEEIVRWSEASDSERRAILHDALQRKEMRRNARG